jgi:ribose 5-phosphate isomerase B
VKIALASDHAGFRYKTMLSAYLQGRGIEVVDFGTHAEEPPVDYPDFIRPAAEAVARGECDRGIVLGGSGIGESIAANRVRGVRCALCCNADMARLSRQHNNANVIALGQRLRTEDEARAIVDAWLTTDFEGGRHLRRIQKLDL